MGCVEEGGVGVLKVFWIAEQVVSILIDGAPMEEAYCEGWKS